MKNAYMRKEGWMECNGAKQFCVVTFYFRENNELSFSAVFQRHYYSMLQCTLLSFTACYMHTHSRYLLWLDCKMLSCKLQIKYFHDFVSFFLWSVFEYYSENKKFYWRFMGLYNIFKFFDNFLKILLIFVNCQENLMVKFFFSFNFVFFFNDFQKFKLMQFLNFFFQIKSQNVSTKIH